jgi:hypothetical protein
MDAAVKAALIGFGGLILGLVLRDALLPLYFFRKRRETELEDQHREKDDALRSRYRSELIQTRDVVRLYADPLLQSCKSLNYRLKEILEQKGRATFLLPQTPQSEFIVYKRISTLYRLATLLGWIRAYRKERSYLDPSEVVGMSEIEAAVDGLQGALADGPHVEDQRLNELLRIWVPSCPPINEQASRGLAVAIDNILRSILTLEKQTYAVELSEEAKRKLCLETAEIISRDLRVEIPDELLTGEQSRAVAFFGIKEAYIYRDWQQAIGDLVLTQITGAPRRFEVIGYDQFESLFLRVDKDSEETGRRWVRRLDAVFAGLEPDKEDLFDARRDQLKRVLNTSERLQVLLEKKVEEYFKLTADYLSNKRTN